MSVAFADGEELAQSDFEGRMVLERETWPEWVELRVDGYGPNEWRAASHWFHYSQRFWMERVK